MAQPAIPEEIRRFVLTSIPSVPHLEALLLLRADAQLAWRTDKVAERLYIGDKVAAGLLDELTQAGMLEHILAADGSQCYRYQPATDTLRSTIDSLADLYAKRLVDVTHLIHSKLDRKAQQFADAFKWRKDS